MLVYSLKKCNSTAIFEDNQANLEQAVEDLSEMLEKPIDATTIMQLKSDMVNKTNYVEKRAGIILSDTLQGHYEVCGGGRYKDRCGARADSVPLQSRWEFNT